jgi:Ser/Thr protein kinase RdoA (MazF antagonist)
MVKGQLSVKLEVREQTKALEPLTGVVFPVVHSVLGSAGIGAMVAEAYGLDAFFQCELLLAGMNDTYLLTTRQTRYVARVYRAAWRSAAAIAYELDLLVHLADRGVPVSAPVRARDGRLARPLLTPEGTRHLALFTYAAGDPFTWTNLEHCDRAGRLLAALHGASDDFASAHARAALDLEYLIEIPLAAIRPFLAHRPGDLAYLVAFATRLRSRLATLGTDLDWGVCHGDFSSTGNFRVANDSAVAVFDFDLCGPGWRVFDLAPIQRAAVGYKNRRIWRTFLRGYLECRRLGPADLAAVPLFYALARLWSLGMRAAHVDRWGVLFMGDWYVDWQLRVFRQWEAGHNKRDT